jgi:hypothetical protein
MLVDGTYVESIPDWQGNERVRQGMQALLTQDRCMEEKQLLLRDQQALQEYAHERWTLLEFAYNAIPIEDIEKKYLFQTEQSKLLKTIMQWRRDTSSIPHYRGEGDGSSWGPTNDELFVGAL